MTGFHCGTVLFNGSRALRIGRWYSQYQPITKPCWGGLQNAATSQPPLQSKPPSLFAWIITTFAPPQSIPTTAAGLILSWNLSQMTDYSAMQNLQWFLTALKLKLKSLSGQALHHLVPFYFSQLLSCSLSLFTLFQPHWPPALPKTCQTDSCLRPFALASPLTWITPSLYVHDVGSLIFCKFSLKNHLLGESAPTTKFPLLNFSPQHLSPTNYAVYLYVVYCLSLCQDINSVRAESFARLLIAAPSALRRVSIWLVVCIQ